MNKDKIINLLKDLIVELDSEQDIKPPKLPTKWEDIYNGDNDYEFAWCEIPTNGMTENCKFVKLSRLIILKNRYNGNWSPTLNGTTAYPCVYNSCGNIIKSYTVCMNHIFTFKTKELRDEFYTNFKSDLEYIKEYI